ncbi:MAG: YhgE/Pip domain-containing protein [Eggerthellaceae bacterium]|nr:YhgE/Pip domain-containing protein [Eggerthellaceae bacterium]
MALNGIRFATLEWKNLVSSKVMWIVAGAIAVIPLLYGALYLAAFENPYERLSRVPVAVVNLDEGALVNGEHRVLGDEVVSSLRGSSDGLGWHFVSQNEAQKGLEDGRFFMSCTIPADFSQSIASAESGDPHQARLLVEYNQGQNMLASQMGRVAWRQVQQQVNAAVIKEYWNASFARVASMAKQLMTASAGAAQLEEGIAQAQKGSAVISEKLGELSSGVASLASGLGRMQVAVDDVPSQLSQLQGELDGLAGKAAAALAGASGGLREVEAGLAELASIASAGDAADLTRMEEAARDLAQGLANVRSQLEAAAPALQDDAARVIARAEQLLASVPELTAGVNAAAEGAVQLQDGASQLEAGSKELVQGLDAAVSGAGELASRLEQGADEASAQVENADAKANMMSSPVVLAESYYTQVDNYGTGFAPYFMALALWVGGLVAGFVFKPLNGRLVLAGAHPVTAALANYLPMALFACIQATLLMLVVQFGLKLQIDNVVGFYAVGYLTALTFAAIMQMLAAAMGVPGRFVAIILLMLQLTSSAGTFPVQTTPAFFQAINPFMPMTYVVAAFRQVMSGLDYMAVLNGCVILACMGALCFALTCLVARAKRTLSMDDLHPLIQLS